MTLFVHGLLPSIQTFVTRFRESKGRCQLSYDDLVQYAQYEGKSPLAIIASLRVAKLVIKNLRD